MQGANERRREPRYRISLSVQPDPEEPLQVWKTRDLSLLGLFVLTDGRPAIDSRQTFTFAWGGRSYTCEIRVVRHGQDGIGVEFCDPSPKVQQVLEEIIAQCSEAERVEET